MGDAPSLRLDGVRAVVTDIEGTTSSISFVHDVLFPFARERLKDFIARRGGEHDVRILLDVAKNDAGDAGMGDAELADALTQWIAEDRKNTALKSLQGLIWEEGYRNGTLRGHVYPDAADALTRWAANGIKLYVYSSGSVAAQKLIFGHSPYGDLTPLFAGYFDTTIGPKKQPDSYQRIAQAIGYPASAVVFLSDSAEEIAAANRAGLRTVQFVRPDESQAASPGQATARSFADISIGAA